MQSPHANDPRRGPVQGPDEVPSASTDPSSGIDGQLPNLSSTQCDYDYEQTLNGHSAPVTAVAILMDDRIVTGSEDSTLLVWRSATKEDYDRLWREVRDQYTRGLPADTCTLFGEHRAAQDALMRERMVQGELKGHADSITSIASMGDGRVVSGSKDGALIIWSERKGETAWNSTPLRGHRGAITSLRVLDERTIVSGSIDGAVRVWSDDTGAWRSESLLGHTGSVQAIDRFANGDILSGGVDGTARIWRRSNFGWDSHVVAHGHDEIRSVKALSDIEFVATGLRTAHMWRLDAETDRWSWYKREGVQGAQILLDGSVVAFTGDPGVIVWRCDDRHGWREVAFRKDWRDMVSLTPLSCGRILMRTRWMDEGWMRRDVEVLRVDQEDNLTCDVLFTQKAAYNEVRDLSLPDGRFGIVCKDGSIQIYRGAPIRGS